MTSPPSYGVHLLPPKKSSKTPKAKAPLTVAEGLLQLFREDDSGMDVTALRETWKGRFGFDPPPRPSVRRTLLQLVKEGKVYRYKDGHHITSPEISFLQAWWAARHKGLSPQEYLDSLSDEDLKCIDHLSFEDDDETLAVFQLIVLILGCELPGKAHDTGEIARYTEFFRIAAAGEVLVRENSVYHFRDPKGRILTGKSAFKSKKRRKTAKNGQKRVKRAKKRRK